MWQYTEFLFNKKTKLRFIFNNSAQPRSKIEIDYWNTTLITMDFLNLHSVIHTLIFSKNCFLLSMKYC